MLIPSIDLQGGQIVQLVQGERLAVSTDDVEGWVRRFASFPKVQLIDLDAAKNERGQPRVGRIDLRQAALPRGRRHAIARARGLGVSRTARAKSSSARHSSAAAGRTSITRQP